MITGVEPEEKKGLVVRTEKSEAALKISGSSLDDLVKAVPPGSNITGFEYAAQQPQDSKTYGIIGKCGKDCSQCSCKNADKQYKNDKL